MDIKIDQDIMLINILGKFGNDLMKNVQVRERTKVKCLILKKSRAITQMWLMQFGWLLNMANNFHLYTFCASSVKIK